MPAVRTAASAALLTLTSINLDFPRSLWSISWITNQLGWLTLWNYFSLLLSEKPRHRRWDFGFMNDWHSHHLLIRCSRFMTDHNTHTVNNTPERNSHFLLHSSTITSNPSSTSNAFWSHCHSLWLELSIMEYASQSSALNQKHVPALFPPPVIPSSCQALNHIPPRAIMFSHWVVFTFLSIFFPFFFNQHLLQKPEMSFMFQMHAL